MKGAMRSYSFLVEGEAIQPDCVAVPSGSDESATPGLSAIRRRAWRTSIAMSPKPTSGQRRSKLVPGHNFRVAHDPGTMSRFAPRIVGQLARICLAYYALFESFGFLQKSHTMHRAPLCRQTVNKSTRSKTVVSGTPHLPLVPHSRNLQPRPVLMTDSPNSFPTNKN